MDNLLQRVRTALAERYEVTSEAGRGAMAVVYRAVDLRHSRSVAVKVLQPELASAVGRERFLHEVRLAAGLSHPYVLPVLDSGEADGLLYCVMPFLEGETLEARLRREGPLPIDDALRITAEIAEALGHAHAAGILHRDVKPSNILLTEEHALLADFGIARALDRAGEDRLTGTGVSVGTPGYMSPQQADTGVPSDARDDQYSLACVLYEMLAGAPPFTGPSVGAVLRRHATDPVPPIRTVRPSVPSRVEAALERALSKAAPDRFPSVGAFAAALQAAGVAGSVAVGWRGVSRRVVATAVLGVVGLVFLTTFTFDRGIADASEFEFAVACVPYRQSDTTFAADLMSSSIRVLEELGAPYPVGWYQMRTWQEAQHLGAGLDTAAALAALEQLAATFFVHCLVSDLTGDSAEIRQRVVAADEPVRTFEPIVVNRRAPITSTARHMAAQLVGMTGRSLRSQPEDWTSDHVAWLDFHAGERAFLAYDLPRADSLFGRVLRRDPNFGLALWRRSHIHRWMAIPETSGIDLDSLFATDRARFNRRDRLLLEAVLEPPGPLAIARFEAMLNELPRDDYPLLVYADELFHRGTLGEMGLGLDSAENVLERVIELNPLWGPAWDHLALVRIIRGEAAGARVAVDSLCLVQGQTGGVFNPCAYWRLGWLERFRPAEAAGVRADLAGGEIADLLRAARLARYANLYPAQLELGNALIRRGSSPDSVWHSGVNAVGVALAALGQPGASVQRFADARTASPEAALFADLWAVVPAALGLEGFPAELSAAAGERLSAVVSDARADSLHRARAAWGLALEAARDDPAEFDRAVERLEGVLPRALPGSDRLATLLYGVEARLRGDPSAALRITDTLLAYDSISNTERPLLRSALYLLRGRWHAEAGDGEMALRAWMWHHNTDLESVPVRRVQAAEVDGALAGWARAYSARVARTLGPAYSDRACAEARGVLELWEEAADRAGPAEPALAPLLAEMREILSEPACAADVR
jgi:tRNA A-37 threonylcarbamoyl transferase component Bud32/tetratricopeptide (TPR) repeat protein